MSFIRKRFSRASANPGTGASDDHQRFVGCLFARIVALAKFVLPEISVGLAPYLLSAIGYWLFAKRAIGYSRSVLLAKRVIRSLTKAVASSSSPIGSQRPLINASRALERIDTGNSSPPK